MAEWNYADWAEKAGNENLKHRLGTGDVLLAQANTLLTVLLTGIGGGLSYAVKLTEPGEHTSRHVGCCCSHRLDGMGGGGVGASVHSDAGE